MKLSTYAELQKMTPDERGETVQAIEGTLKTIFKQSEAQEKHELQNGIIEFGKGEEMKVSFSKCAYIDKKREGSKLIIACKEGRDLTGLKVKYDDYPKGKGSNILSVTATAQISWGDAPAGGGSRESGGDRQSSGSRTESAHQPTPASRSSSADERPAHERYAAVHRIVAKSTLLYAMSSQSLVYVRKCHEKIHGKPMTPEQEQSALGLIFIESAKQGALNALPIWDFLKGPPVAPSADDQAKADSDKKAAEEARKVEEEKKQKEAAEAKLRDEKAAAEKKRLAEEDVPF